MGFCLDFVVSSAGEEEPVGYPTAAVESDRSQDEKAEEESLEKGRICMRTL